MTLSCLPNAKWLLYDTGGDVTQMVLLQVDCEGNVNVSSFGPRMPGCGGFIDIRYVLQLLMPLPGHQLCTLPWCLNQG